MRSLLRRLVSVGIKTADEVKAVLLLQEYFAHVAGKHEAEQGQEDLQGTAKCFDVGIVKQAAGDRDDMVVFQGQTGVQDRCHQAAWPILHPPGAVQGCVEGHDEVPVLGQLSNLQVEADDKRIPANPEHPSSASRFSLPSSRPAALPRPELLGSRCRRSLGPLSPLRLIPGEKNG